jgi:hypothetical protein
MDNDISEGCHSFHLLNQFRRQDAVFLEQAEIVPDCFRKSKPFRSYDMSGQIDHCLDGPLKVQNKYVLLIYFLKTIRVRMRRFFNSFQASLDDGDLG